MGCTIAEKIIKAHTEQALVQHDERVALKIDQTLTQDATGTMAYLQLEALGIDRVKTELSVAYIDHNMLQNGYMNADDHRFIQSAAKKYGIYFSRPGNGICHQVHLERFGKPGKTLIGSDSHTPTCGGLAMLAFGAGGFDVAAAMAGFTYSISMPKFVKINLKGKFKPWVGAKDVVLKVLSILDVKGGVGKILEYSGEGVLNLSVPERATITNMGAEVGATSSIFPSDKITLEFLKAQGREEDWVALDADEDAVYDEVIDIDLSELDSLVACPNSPGNIASVSSLQGLKIDQVCIGSCTNSSLTDMMRVANILRGHTVCEGVSLSIAPGSKQVLSMMARSGMLADMIDSGARILECACGPCIGMGQSPKSGGVSLRTFNRNFLGRSGTPDASVYLVSPEVAAFSAINGVLDTPSGKINMPSFNIPEKFLINDNMILSPASKEEAKKVLIEKGPNIKSFPIGSPFKNFLAGKIVIKVADDITTDHIMPAGAKVLPYRSNIPKMAEFCFEVVDECFAKRAREVENGIIVGGFNYGQGSSREHAALVPLYLGIKIVLAKSFARIHKANLVNVGILPLTFSSDDDYENINEGDELVFENLLCSLESGYDVKVLNKSSSLNFKVSCDLNLHEKQVVLAGGMLNYIRNR